MFSFKTLLYTCLIDMSGILDPAAVFSIAVTTSNGNNFVINVDAESGRTAEQLTTVIRDLIPLVHSVKSLDTTRIFFSDIGPDLPTSDSSEFVATATGLEIDHTVMIGISAVGGLLLSRVI